MYVTRVLIFRFLSFLLSTIVLYSFTSSAFAASRVKSIQKQSSDIVVADFEGTGWGDWDVQGTAFGSGPLLGQDAANVGIRGVHGIGVASSNTAGDGATGSLTSSLFVIKRQYISFEIGGGRFEHATCLDLIINGQVVRSATGLNDDLLLPASWNVSSFIGMSARLRIMDTATESWGHINVDHILQTDHPEKLPVTTQPLYQETYRPQFHFTARQWTESRLNPGPREEGWCNDMNGLVYYDGEYHLFAQRWDKCWIHAVSRDLIHWTELQPAFWEESLESGVQSGNCVIDYKNTSGLSPFKGVPPMVAFWARQDQRSICVTFSIDHGRTWKFYAHNPILIHPERDPMVFWYAPTQHWVMMMYGNNQYHILTSTNLLDWTDQHHPIPDSFECPDFFQLPLDGSSNNLKWVLIRGNGKYSVGTFDGVQFTPETAQLDSNGGPNFYATQTWGNTNTGDGRRIQAAWMRGGVYPDMPFNQQVSFPSELTLHSTPNGPRLYRLPIKEISSLQNHEDIWSNKTVGEGQTLNLHEPGDLFQVKMNVDIPVGATLTMNIRGVPLILTHQSVTCQNNPQNVLGEINTVEILIDRTSIESYVNQGEVSTALCFLPNDSGLTLSADGGPVTIKSLFVYQLNSAWKSVSSPTN